MGHRHHPAAGVTIRIVEHLAADVGVTSETPAFIFSARSAAFASRSRLCTTVAGSAQLPVGEPVGAPVQQQVQLRILGQRRTAP